MADWLARANHEGVILPKRQYFAGSAEKIVNQRRWRHSSSPGTRDPDPVSHQLDLKAREMARPTRTYKLKVSPAGFDLIVDSHARLVRVTRTLLPYGLALHAALYHLEGLNDDSLSQALSEFPRMRLGGGRNGTIIFVGAPKGLAELADRLMARLGDLPSRELSTGKGDLYLVALQAMMEAEPATLLAAYGRVLATDSVRSLKKQR